MRALVTTSFGSSPKMQIETREIPILKPGFSLVKIHAATVNPLSNMIRAGIVPAASAPLVLSNDGAGTVVSSDRYAPGTPVAIYGGGELGITQDGLQQQYVLVENKRLVDLPSTVSLDDAAGLPINYVSAYQAIKRVGQLQAGQTVLISGASGSVGHALVQLCKAFGARVIATVSNSTKCANAKLSGANHVIDLSVNDLQQQVQTLTDGNGVDLAFDTVGGELLGQLMKALTTRGTLVSIGFTAGMKGSVDVADIVIYEKRLLGYDAHLETDEDVAEALAALKQLLADGLIKPRIDSVFGLTEFEQAYTHLTSRQAQGTILLQLHLTEETTNVR